MVHYRYHSSCGDLPLLTTPPPSLLSRSVPGSGPPVPNPEVHVRLRLSDLPPDAGRGWLPRGVLQGSAFVLGLHPEDRQVLPGEPGLPLGRAGHLGPHEPEELLQRRAYVLHAPRGATRALQLPQSHPARPRARTRPRACALTLTLPRPRARALSASLPVLRAVR